MPEAHSRQFGSILWYFREKWSRKKKVLPQACGDQQLPLKLGGILQLPVGRRDFSVRGARAGSAAENTS